MNRPSFLPLALRVFFGLLLATLAVQPASAFYFDQFGDGFWQIVSQNNNQAMTSTTTGSSQYVNGTTAFQMQYELLLNIEDNTYRIRHRDTSLCIGALNGGTTAGTAVVALTNYTGAASQRWNFTSVGNNVWRITNVASGLALQTDAASVAKVTLQPVSTSNKQYWTFAYQIHYPKKGIAGWNGNWWNWSTHASWAYDWGTGGSSIPPWFAYSPMQWGNWGPPNLPPAGNQTLPVYLMGFNEPDHSDQSNMTTAQAIGLWPQMQANNWPLVGPVPANSPGAWADDFYNQIGAKGYRVDYTAIHWYGYPTTSNLINTINNTVNAYGRATWLTEFSNIDWGGNQGWTEEQDWTFLAEFLWQAEDMISLKRYSMFVLSNDPPANPWTTSTGGWPSSIFYGDNTRLTSIGELYIGWDADRSITTRTPYMLQGKESMYRLSDISPTGTNFLGQVNIHSSDAQTQWVLLPSPTSGQFYIVSALDGRRLQTDGKGVSFAAANTTGTAVQWSIAPDSSGYFFVNNPATNTTLFNQRWNNGDGSPSSVYYGVEASGNAADITRFRLVKPYTPVAIPAAPPAAPVATVKPGDRRVQVSWPAAAAQTYAVSRSTSPSGPFTTLASGLTLNTYIDNTAVNGVTYYYNVTTSDAIQETSAASTAVAGTPAAALATPGLEADYKFEASAAQDNSGNAQAGQVNGGVSFFSPGRVDGMAANFNGTDSYVQLPAVVANDFSIACWVRTTATAGTGSGWWTGMGLVDADAPGYTSDFGLALLGAKAAFGVGGINAVNTTTLTGTTAINDGNWHHLVATRNNSTGAIQLYVDGALQASGTGATGTRSAPAGLRLGGILSGGGFFKGDLDEVRLYSYVLAPSEIAQLATSAANGLVAEYNFLNGAARDASGLGNHGSANAVSFGSPGKVDAVAASFDGASSYVQVPQSLTNDFSVAFWLKTTSTGGTGTQWYSGSGLVDAEVPGSTSDFGTSLLGGKVAFGIGGADVTITSTGTVSDGAWHHVVATRANTNGTMRLYVDGVLQATGTGPIGSRTAPAAITLGRILSGGNFYQGLLDDVRLYNYALSAGQVQALLNPVPAPYTAQDIGSPAASGYASLSNNVWTIGGSGSDIWTTGDAFTLVSTPQSGAGTLIARLTALPVNADGTTTANSKAGIIWRDGNAANAAFVDLVYDQGQGLQFISRGAAGAAATQTVATVSTISTAPVWLKLVRGGGDVFRAYYSTSTSATPPGILQYTYLGSYTVPFSSTAAGTNALAGLAVCSHQDGTLASATFDNFVLAGDTAPGVTSPGDQSMAENTSSGALGVVVTDTESAPAALVLTATSSNPTLLPASGIVLGGASASRSVTLTPAPNQAGTATVTLSASDGQLTTTNSFVVTVTTTAAGSWREQYFGTTANSGVAADGANPAGDGISNFFKRAYGLSPLVAVTNPGAVLPQLSRNVGAGTLSLTYTRAVAASVPDLTFQVLWSHDLANWSSNGVSDAITGSNPANNTETHAGTVPTSLGSPLFLKLQVTRN